MGSCAAPSAKGDDKFITTDYLQQCPTLTAAFTTITPCRRRLRRNRAIPEKNTPMSMKKGAMKSDGADRQAQAG
ncbi:hypothetical protein, partial [Proteus mirabilis]|uniref:hypothetical protein n=1 Tax=Proteus mirabilis TaxID=584 RepID=UPI001BB09D94